MADCGCTCLCCSGATGWSDEPDHCRHCWLLGNSMVYLGLSIRHFVRRAEVEGLVEQVRESVGNSLLTLRGLVDVHAALDRLAELAMEVE